MGTQYFHSQDPWAISRELDDKSYSVDHFFTKLFKLPGLMNTELGRTEGLKRVETMVTALKALAIEIEEPLNEVTK
jgi:uncharacterized protein